jgi:hypothetical protein
MTETEHVTTSDIMRLLGRKNLGSTRGWIHVHKIEPLPWRTPSGENVYRRADVQREIDNEPRGRYRTPPRPQNREPDGDTRQA